MNCAEKRPPLRRSDEGKVKSNGTKNPYSCHCRSNRSDCDVIYEEHNSNEDGKCQEAIGDNLIDLIGESQFTLLLALPDRLINERSDVVISLVRDDGFCIIILFRLTFENMLFDVILDLLPDTALL